MKNFQFRKANNERFFFGECPGKVGRLGGGGARLGLYMYVYRPLLSNLSATLLIFQNSKKHSLKIK